MAPRFRTFAKETKRLVRKLLGYEPKNLLRSATEEDVYFCYRLFLKREPDAEGLSGWTKLLGERSVPLRDLVAMFMKTLEYEYSNTKLVRLPEFQICVRPSDGTVSTAILNDRNYEPYLMAEMTPLLKPGMVVVDVGANIGYQTLMAARHVGPTGRVLAFEPNPDNTILLKESIRRNGFTNIELFPFGVADRSRTIEMLPDGQNSTSLVRDPETDGTKRTTPLPPKLSRCHVLQAVALDEFLGDRERIDLIKIDIDGGEPRALQGMEKIIQRHRPVMFVEYCPQCIRVVCKVAPETMLDFFFDRDYNLYDLNRATGKSSKPMNKEELTAAYVRSGITHLDLMACPR